MTETPDTTGTDRSIVVVADLLRPNMQVLFEVADGAQMLFPVMSWVSP